MLFLYCETRPFLHDFYLPLLHQLALDVVEEVAHRHMLRHGRVLLFRLRVSSLLILLCVYSVLIRHFLEFAQYLIQVAFIAIVRRRLAFEQSLTLKVAMLVRDDVYEVV